MFVHKLLKLAQIILVYSYFVCTLLRYFNLRKSVKSVVIIFNAILMNPKLNIFINFGL